MLPVKTNKTAAKKSGAFSRALDRFAQRQQAKRRSARIGFIVDATASRRRTWEQAQSIQARMFRAAARLNALTLRLVHFGGGEITDHGWISDPRLVAANMAGVRCVSGMTQILPALFTFAQEEQESRAAAIILIGDSFEEDSEMIENAAHTLKQAGIRVFSFHEGEDWTARDTFTRLADLTGGRFARFGEELPLADLCEGVALLTAGGDKALRRLPNKKVRQLLLSGPDKTR